MHSEFREFAYPGWGICDISSNTTDKTMKECKRVLFGVLRSRRCNKIHGRFVIQLLTSQFCAWKRCSTWKHNKNVLIPLYNVREPKFWNTENFECQSSFLYESAASASWNWDKLESSNVQKCAQTKNWSRPAIFLSNFFYLLLRSCRKHFVEDVKFWVDLRHITRNRYTP
jgi:hypothetical protein